MKLRRVRTLPTLAIASALLATTASAGPRFAMGEINLSGTAQVSFTDRVAPNAFSSSDTIYSFTPQISYTRDDSRLELNAALSTPFVRYGSSDEFNSNNLNASVSGNVPFNPASRLSGRWNIGYFDGVESNLLRNRNQEMERLSASLTSNVRLLRKIALRVGADFSSRDSTEINAAQTNSNRTTGYSIGVQGHDLLFGKVGAYATYQWQNRETTGGSLISNVDDTDEGINFGVTGQILPERLFPKLDADLSFGFASSKDLQNRGGDRNHLTLNGRLSYPPTAKTNVSLNVNRNLNISDDDRSVLSSVVSLAFQYTPRQKLSFGANASLASQEYLDGPSDRTDDVSTIGVNVRYIIRTNWSASTYYNFRNSSSELAIGDYTSSVFGIATTLTY